MNRRNQITEFFEGSKRNIMSIFPQFLWTPSSIHLVVHPTRASYNKAAGFGAGMCNKLTSATYSVRKGVLHGRGTLNFRSTTLIATTSALENGGTELCVYQNW